jgi:mannitol/fructose-specific phosphotransferase system IIA component (Ntr-type)
MTEIENLKHRITNVEELLNDLIEILISKGVISSEELDEIILRNTRVNS